MLLRITTLFLLALSLHAQVTFLAGTPADIYCTKPVSPCKTGSTCLYTDSTVTNAPKTLLYGYGVGFSCTILAAVPTDVILGVWEPNQTAAGKRTFNVSVNGGAPVLVDPWALAGDLKKLATVTFPHVQPAGGIIKIDFTKAIGNPLVSITTANPTPMPGPPGPQGFMGLTGPQSTVDKIGGACVSGDLLEGILVVLRQADGTRCLVSAIPLTLQVMPLTQGLQPMLANKPLNPVP